MAGNQVLEWTDLDDEIKTAGVDSVSPHLPIFPRIRLYTVIYINRIHWPLPICKLISSVTEILNFTTPHERLVNSNMRHNWRTAWSFFNENIPIAYKSELPQFRFAYTKDTYNNPQNLWTFA
ncbi:hypothetical protein PHLCEN_2v6265 [Hermanssonia centrifuga]|uniref:Uncharacterized protein n=1 Tax=Hermanssonia centrifuga TaxID=98765 RepID=A0A2R6NZW2_9APHY|nr:hypothetical protein PHLCEN_2v6265 [Hermanssonia centrifuga]